MGANSSTGYFRCLYRTIIIAINLTSGTHRHLGFQRSINRCDNRPYLLRRNTIILTITRHGNAFIQSTRPIYRHTRHFTLIRANNNRLRIFQQPLRSFRTQSNMGTKRNDHDLLQILGRRTRLFGNGNITTRPLNYIPRGNGTTVIKLTHFNTILLYYPNDNRHGTTNVNTNMSIQGGTRINIRTLTSNGDFTNDLRQRRTIRRTSQNTNTILFHIKVTTMRYTRKIYTRIPRNNAITNSSMTSTKRLHRLQQRTNRQATNNKRSMRTLIRNNLRYNTNTKDSISLTIRRDTIRVRYSRASNKGLL